MGEDAREPQSVSDGGGRGESNLVKIKNFHGASTETREKCGEGDDLGGWVGDVRVAGKGESNLVQAVFMQTRWSGRARAPFLIAKLAGWEYDWTLTLDALEWGLGCSIPVGKARSRSQLDLRN